MLHLLLHIAVPLAVARLVYPARWLAAFGVLMLGMIVDVDHLLADPVYDPGRCSIGFHPLHTLVPIGIYVALFAHERTRLLGLGLCLHMALDALDCRVTSGVWWFG